ncbi:MAG: hypothetical protein AAF849_08860 [Bacteroidota bacterium]
MYQESDIPNFEIVFQEYKNLYQNIEKAINAQTSIMGIIDLYGLRHQFNFFDLKLRLSFSINSIGLNQDYMQRKTGDLKLCHLMLYKFNDLWFAYEAFVKLYGKFNGQSIQSNKKWLENEKYSACLNTNEVQEAIIRANQELNSKFNTPAHRQSLDDYIDYCISQSNNKSQKNRLTTLSNKIDIPNNISDLSITDLLSLAFAMRNNFVHNGETTVTTPELHYRKKKDSIIILYELLAIVTLRLTSKMIKDKVDSYSMRG